MEAHHYCSALNEEVFQCVIYDGNTAEAKLMGVEYIISQRLFTQLPAKRKPCGTATLTKSVLASWSRRASRKWQKRA